MASGGGQSKSTERRKGPPKGYDLSIVDRPPLDKKFCCKLCELILREPMQGYCGHRFCLRCITCYVESHRDEKYCPSCLEENDHDELSFEHMLDLKTLFVDNAMKRDSKNIAVHCINPNCPWKGNLQQYADHESNCEFKCFRCVCGRLIALFKEQKHLKDECDMRQVICPYCGIQVVFKLLQSHQEDCDKVPFKCKFCGKENILRQEEEHHYSKECKVKMSVCPICFDKVPVGTVLEHIQKDVVSHLLKMNSRVTVLKAGSEYLAHPIQESTFKEQLENINSRLQKIEVHPALTEENLSAKGAKRDAEASKLDEAAGGGAVAGAEAATGSDSLSELKKQVESLGQRVSVFDSIGSVLNQEIMGILVRVEQFEARLGSGSALAPSAELEETKAKLRQLEQALSSRDSQIAELGVQLKNQEITSYDGTLLWKITDVARRRSDARAGNVGSIYSHPFYTSRTGYKMCARLYFNGDGMGRNTHLSLYFVVMKGEFDNLMRWPFRQKVTLILMDFNRREHVSDAFRPDPASTSFRQPQTNMNIASGCPLFCQLSRLDTPGSSCYIKDDTMFIKIIVDTADL